MMERPPWGSVGTLTFDGTLGDGTPYEDKITVFAMGTFVIMNAAGVRLDPQDMIDLGAHLQELGKAYKDAIATADRTFETKATDEPG